MINKFCLLQRFISNFPELFFPLSIFFPFSVKFESVKKRYKFLVNIRRNKLRDLDASSIIQEQVNIVVNEFGKIHIDSAKET
jgi:hypothetical protein